MRFIKFLLSSLLFGALLVPLAAHAEDAPNIFTLYAGVNGAWFDGPATEFPADIELGGNASASLSPHISAVAATYYGFDHSYFRYSAGGRATITDVDNPNLSVGLGIQYQGASEAEIRPNEWAPDVSIGWVPWAEKWPSLILVGQGSYGLVSSKARVIAGVRYRLNLK